MRDRCNPIYLVNPPAAISADSCKGPEIFHNGRWVPMDPLTQLPLVDELPVIEVVQGLVEDIPPPGPGMPPECTLPPMTAEQGRRAFDILADMVRGIG